MYLPYKNPTHAISLSIVFCEEDVMVLSACALKDDRKKTGWDDKAAQGGQKVCWSVEKTVPQRDYILRHLDRSPRGTSTVGPGLLDDHCVQWQKGNPFDLSGQLNELGRLCAV